MARYYILKQFFNRSIRIRIRKGVRSIHHSICDHIRIRHIRIHGHSIRTKRQLRDQPQPQGWTQARQMPNRPIKVRQKPVYK